ncbi:MAG TPA: carbohydrate-binding family 9-like protein, partial [Verrucomicrobiae bacterium]|nr:carbohydrate-binding family 9-like protein [Verrucomicrobiae bacterium]
PRHPAFCPKTGPLRTLRQALTPWNLLAMSLLLGTAVRGEDAAAARDQSKFPCNPEAAAHYTAYQAGQPVKIDGHLDEQCWKLAPRSPRFTDIITGGPTMYDTRAAVLWDDKNLYVAYWVEEPDVAATFTEHGSPIYYNNDVEVFIAGRDAYY